MGYYINNSNGSSYQNKRNALIEINAIEIDTPTEWQENLCCVVDNGIFAAVGFAYDEEEMKVFLEPDGRKKSWFIVPNAKQLAGYNH